MGSGEKILKQYVGYKTPRGKVNVDLYDGKGKFRSSTWGKYTMINVERKDTDLPILVIDVLLLIHGIKVLVTLKDEELKI